MSISIKQNSRIILPNFNTTELKLDKTKVARSDVMVNNKSSAQDNAKEEISIAVASKLADDKRNIGKKENDSSELFKRVDRIEKINSIINQLNMNDKKKDLSNKINKNIEFSEEKFLKYVSDSLNDNEEPALVFLALKKSLHSKELNDSQKNMIKSTLNKIIDDENYLSKIKTSINIADVSARYFENPKLASSFRMLVGQGNASMADPSTIISTLLQAGNEENYGKLLNAYTDSLAKEISLPPPIPSTHLGYLKKTFQTLNNQVFTKSLLKISDTCCGMLEKKLNSGRINRAEFAKDLIDYTKLKEQYECQKSIEIISKKYGILGKDRMITVASQARKMLDSLALQLWNGNSDMKFNSINQIQDYINKNSSHRPINLTLNKTINDLK